MIHETHTETPLHVDVIQQTEKSRRTFDEVIDIIILLISAVLVAAIVCTFLVQFNVVAFINWQNFTLNTFILTGSTASFYVLLRSYTKRKGRRTDVWVNAATEYEGKVNHIFHNNLSRHAAAYCRDWEKNRLDIDRKAEVEVVGITLEEYNELYRIYSPAKKFLFWGKSELERQYPDLTKEEFKAIRKASKVRRCHYNPNYITGTQRSGRRRAASPSEQISAATVDKLINIRTIASCFITASFSIGVFSDIIFVLTAQAIIACIIKLAIVAIFGVAGMVSGYSFTTKREVEEMKAHARELNNFITWCALTPLTKRENTAEKVSREGNIDKL